MTPRYDLRVLRIMAAGYLALVCFGYSAVALTASHAENVYQHAYMRTVELMRGGASFYAAHDAALREVVGPAGTVRAFRMPTVFFLWRWLPSESWIWAGFVLAVAATAWLLATRVVEMPLLAPLVATYLFAIGLSREGSVWVAQFTFAEFWALPAIVGALVAWRRESDLVAVGLALCAFLVREQAALLVLGGLVAAHVTRRRRWPWVLAAGLAVTAYLLHAAMTAPYLVESGTEAMLLGTADLPWSITRMMSVGVPVVGGVVGPLLWALAYWRLRVRPDVRAVAGILLSLPLTGLAVDRPYWGLLVVPVAFVLATEQIVASRHSIRSSRSRRPRAARQAT